MERVWFTSTSIEMKNDIEMSTSADASAPPSASHNNHNFSSILSLCSKEYVLEKELIEIDEQNVTPEKLASYKKHCDDATKIACIMVATMVPELQRFYVKGFLQL
ncbi:hypothetical protein L2E82_04145 [Cichorium intybus]|uniref:Uncharacterized protein n=1 Tax=Cichorium intybus TaxID=13427 RepID=A0ACB9H4L4_CICIN|nr:hypothetical protein L2E82_04145 [Cichorium intybus]